MSTSNPRAEQIFAAALEIADPAERRAYLERACPGDEQLRQEVESLVGAHQQAGEFLEGPPTVVASAQGTAHIATPLVERSGERIGRYKLLEQIGEGGFGTVWMAEQEEPVRRRVALKIIKLGMDTREVVARFEAERQALAMMDHPNIARVFDGGATESGRPYFVMELVRGVPITKYCDEQRLNLQQRLSLLAQVCKAVHHAHQKGVIHRDLKPSNILVATYDVTPLPKVIDFGIAKATDHRLTDKTLFTQSGQFVGTPAYMSPEQAGLGESSLDPRSDVYSLGVVLYELLTGQTPFETRKVAESGYDAVLRAIREVEPSKPGARLSNLLPEELKAIAQARRAEPQALNRVVRGELEWIVMKALEKDRNRRYSTAQELAGDLSRYLRNEAVAVGPPSLAYRLRKTVRHHPVTVALTGALTIAALCGVVLRSTLRRGAENQPTSSPLEQLLATVGGLPAAEVLKIAYTGRPPAAPIQAARPQLQFEIVAQRQGESSAEILHDSDILRSGVDPYALLMRPCSAGYLYVFQVDSSGKKEWLFPQNEGSKLSSGTNPVAARQVLKLPAGTNGFSLDNTLGVYAVFSAVRWPQLETALALPATNSLASRSKRLASTVQEPNGLRYRGVGGISTNVFEFDPQSVFGATVESSPKKLMLPGQSFEAARDLVVIERWFRHTDQR